MFHVGIVSLALLVAFQTPFSPWPRLTGLCLSLLCCLSFGGFGLFSDRLIGQAKERKVFGWISLPPLLFFVSLLPSVFSGFSLYISAESLFRVFTMVMILFSAVFAFRDTLFGHRLKTLLCVLLLILGIVGVGQMLAPSAMPSYWTSEAQKQVLPFRVSSLMVNPNLWGAFCAIILNAVLCWFLVSEESKRHWCFFLIFGLYFVNLIASFSRGAWLAAFGGFVLSIVYWRIKRPVLKGQALCTYRLLPFMLACGVIVFPFVSSRIATLSGKSEFGIAQRVLLYKGVLHHIQENFPLGSGIGSFQAAFPAYRLVSGQYVYEAHSDFLHLAAESGIFGLAGLLGFLGFLCYLTIKAKSPEQAFPFFSFMVTGILAANFMTLSYYEFVIIPLLVIGALLFTEAGFWEGSTIQSFCKNSRAIDFADSPVLKLGNLALLVGALAAIGCSALSQSKFESALASMRKSPPDLVSAREDFVKAASYGLLRADIPYQFGLYWMKVSTLVSKKDQREHAIKNALSLFVVAAHNDRRTARYHEAQATAWLALGNTEKAMTSIDQAIKRDRCSVHFAYTKAVLLEREGKVPEALETLVSAIDRGGRFVHIYPKAYTSAIEMAIDLSNKSGDVMGAMRFECLFDELYGETAK